MEQKKETNNTFTNVYGFITKHILMFILASFIGWAYEIGCVYVLYNTYYDRGVLHLPMCPIYGFGLLVLYVIFLKVKNPVIIFTGSTVITTAVEYISYEAVWHFSNVALWTYEDWPLNYKGKISLISSLIFGLMALLFLKLMVPVLNKIFKTKAKLIASIMVTIFVIFCVVWELRFITK